MGNYERNFIEKMREEIEISDLVNDKLEESYGKIRQGEVKMKQRGFKSNRNKFYRNFAAAAAAMCMVAGLSGIFYVNPALAQDIPILGNVFGRLQELRDRKSVV